MVGGRWQLHAHVPWRQFGWQLAACINLQQWTNGLLKLPGLVVVGSWPTKDGPTARAK